MTLSPATIIATAACHTCCAMRKQPCSFNRTEDPEGRRHSARDSHPDRIRRAMKIIHDFESLPVDTAAKIWQYTRTENAD